MTAAAEYTVRREADDVGNAERFADQHWAAVRHVPAWDAWLVWDGARWARDEALLVTELAKQTARSIFQEALDEPDEKRRNALLKHATSSAKEPRIRAMLSLAASDPRLVLTVADLDSDPYQLNTPDGVVDLRTATLRRHNPDRAMTLVTAAGYDPTGRPETWCAVLDRLLGPDLAAWFQQLAGRALIGQSREHVLPILHGAGANGKTTILETIRRVLGDYGHAGTAELLMASKRDGGSATPELAALRGRRFVTVAETREDGRLAVERVKAITGGDAITARHLYGQPFTFRPSHTIFLATNRRPRVPDDGDAIWRRLQLVPFTTVIPAEERDPDLLDRLWAERDAILGWLVQGCAAAQHEPLPAPDVVQAATVDYRAGEDFFGSFLAERTITDPAATVAAGDLRAAYTSWAEANGAPRLTTSALADRMIDRGYTRGRTMRARLWNGLRLSDDADDAETPGVWTQQTMSDDAMTQMTRFPESSEQSAHDAIGQMTRNDVPPRTSLHARADQKSPDTDVMTSCVSSDPQPPPPPAFPEDTDDDDQAW